MTDTENRNMPDTNENNRKGFEREKAHIVDTEKLRTLCLGATKNKAITVSEIAQVIDACHSLFVYYFDNGDISESLTWGYKMLDWVRSMSMKEGKYMWPTQLNLPPRLRRKTFEAITPENAEMCVLNGFIYLADADSGEEGKLLTSIYFLDKARSIYRSLSADYQLEQGFTAALLGVAYAKTFSPYLLIKARQLLESAENMYSETHSDDDPMMLSILMHLTFVYDSLRMKREVENIYDWADQTLFNYNNEEIVGDITTDEQKRTYDLLMIYNVVARDFLAFRENAIKDESYVEFFNTSLLLSFLIEGESPYYIYKKTAEDIEALLELPLYASLYNHAIQNMMIGNQVSAIYLTENSIALCGDNEESQDLFHVAEAYNVQGATYESVELFDLAAKAYIRATEISIGDKYQQHFDRHSIEGVDLDAVIQGYMRSAVRCREREDRLLIDGLSGSTEETTLD